MLATSAPLNPELPKSLLLVLLLKAPQELEIVFPSRVTAPDWAKARPQRIVALVVRVTLSFARMLPAKAVLVPRVAELPTTKKTPLVEFPLITDTLEPLAVVSVEPI